MKVGSPPRMRGKVSVLVVNQPKDRITPAHAGKRNRGKPGRHCSQDHPRACGEKFDLENPAEHELGSPPRMRGKASGGGRPRAGSGITPAHAGKSGWWPLVPCRCGDHPRACGEKLSEGSCMPCGLGSPPRMRGKVHLHRTGWQPEGITPAHAGKRNFALG